MIDYFVRQVPLPRKVEGVTIPNNDGSFDIYINSLLPPDRYEQVLEHELRHLRSEHFYLEMPISHMERQADGEELNVVLHPPAGQIPCFHSQEHLASWLNTLFKQYRLDL